MAAKCRRFPVTLVSIVGLVLGFLSVLALLSSPLRKGIEISQAEYGERWPFAIQQLRVRCEGAGAVILTVRGKDYAVNGMASKRYGSQWLTITAVVSMVATVCELQLAA
jgi:hypothetical protein